jgi:hypothetical protein
MDELRDIAVLLEQRLACADEVRLKNVAIARLVAAHNTLVSSKRTGDKEKEALRKALDASVEETKEVAFFARKEVRIANLRFGLAVAIGSAATFGAFQLGRTWK